METLNYPSVYIDKARVENNSMEVISRCKEQGISVAGVVKMVHGNLDIAKIFEKNGCAQIASSRMLHLENLKAGGIKAPLLLIRPPMKSEIKRVIKTVDYCTISSEATVKLLNEEAAINNKIQKLIMAIEMGDLREGIFNRNEIFSLAKNIYKMPNVELVGIHVNMGCFGGIKTTPEKLEEFAEIACKIENIIGKELEIVSGGHSREFPMAIEGEIPKKINHLRIGEIMVTGRWLKETLGLDYTFMYNRSMTLKAEIIEIEDKPSKPIGESMPDMSGKIPYFEDRGIRKRAIIGLGKVDYVDIEQIIPNKEEIKILGASSDHTILDVDDCKEELNIGDVLEFKIKYSAAVALIGAEDVSVIVK